MKTFTATGKDTFSCKSQLKADGFVWSGSSWIGSEAAVEKFKARGFRVKIYFREIEDSEEPQDGGQTELRNAII